LDLLGGFSRPLKILADHFGAILWARVALIRDLFGRHEPKKGPQALSGDCPEQPP